MNIRGFLIILSVLISSLTFSQTNPLVNVQIKGQVIDSLTKETIPFATIKLLDKVNPKTLLKAVASDDDGKFQLVANKKGEFLLAVEYIGKNTLTLPITIGDAKTVDMGIIRISDNAHALTEVVVSAQRPLVTVDLDKIVYSVEDDPDSKTNNVLEMLKKVPMVTVDGEENIQLKGSSNFKIYQNGKPSNMIASNPKDVLRGMPANTVKDIQVITDPGARYDAEGVSGIINIVTLKKSSMDGYTASLNANADSNGGWGGGAYASLKYGKIGFTGQYSYNDRKQPESKSESLRETFDNGKDKNIINTLNSKGASKPQGNGQYGSGELSYELDTLNLINVGFNRYGGNYKSKSLGTFVEMLDQNKNSLYSYDQTGYSKGTYGGTDFTADYQRTFKKKDQLLTASYRLSLSPNDSESQSGIENMTGTPPPTAISNKQFSDADMKEHTFQIDFVTPFNNAKPGQKATLSQSIEAGAKYIIRINESNSGLDMLMAPDNWVNVPDINDEFKHEQDIFAAYTGYTAKTGKWGMKAGLRYESTWLRAKFPIQEAQNFNVNYSNLVPSATLTYQLRPTQNIRFGYNMRISRPGIRQLNPYVNSTDPNNIQVGNPGLDAVKTHSVSVNYGSFSRMLNLNLNMAYDFDNNGVEQISTIAGKVTTTTYENVSRRKSLGLSGYARWSPSQKLFIYANLSGRYSDLKANDGTGLKNSGLSGQIFSGGQFSVPCDFGQKDKPFFKGPFRAGFNIGVFSSGVSLQGSQSSFFFHS
ncbi:MAG: TonB-dependent receptor, partial [Prevotella sp.]|nr:TonB-dependent receptor [Prevotella sp.]